MMLNFSVSPSVLMVEDILCAVEKAIRALPEESAEEIRQETVRTLKRSRKINLRKAEIQALHTLRGNPDLTVLSADKGKATVIHNTTDYVEISYLPEEAGQEPNTAHGAVNHNANQEVCHPGRHRLKLQPYGSRPPRLYGLPKIH
jgi:hypothetical protein